MCIISIFSKKVSYPQILVWKTLYLLCKTTIIYININSLCAYVENFIPIFFIIFFILKSFFSYRIIEPLNEANMVILSENDYLEVRLNSLIADYDVDTLSNLYQPIIGYSALAVYFSLWAEAKNQRITRICSHSQLFNRLQMAPGDFISARKHLEAVGLLKTVLEKNDNTRIYHYNLFAPKTPFAFFDDVLLFGMLIKALGDVDANRFKTIYHYQADGQQGEDISSSFLDVFRPDFNDPAFEKAVSKDNAIGRRSGKINSEFNYDAFFNELSNISQIKSDAFTKKDMKEIERLATLNGIGEEEAALVISDIYNPLAGKGKHIDFQELTKIFQEHSDYSYLLTRKMNKNPNTISGSTELAGKINIMETRSPKQFLTLLQNGSQPALSDLRIVDDLSKKFHLPNPVINVLVDYVLSKNNNILSRALCEKIGASLAREGVTTTIDAMNYLTKVSKKTAKETSKARNEKTEEKQNIVKDKKEDSQLNWDQLLDDIDDGEGGDDGKA